MPWYRSLWTLALLGLLAAWAAVIWVALQVSTIVLNTLQQIVDLAGISP